MIAGVFSTTAAKTWCSCVDEVMPGPLMIAENNPVSSTIVRATSVFPVPDWKNRLDQQSLLHVTFEALRDHAKECREGSLHRQISIASVAAAWARSAAWFLWSGLHSRQYHRAMILQFPAHRCVSIFSWVALRSILKRNKFRRWEIFANDFAATLLWTSVISLNWSPGLQTPAVAR